MGTAHEGRLADTFVELADTLVADFDVPDFLHLLAAPCVELLDVAAAGLMLADVNGRLRLMASSEERSRLLELFELEADEGPCLDCYRTGEVTVDRQLGAADPRWPRFADRAARAGYGSVIALPLRLRRDIIGVLNLFCQTSGELDRHRLRLAQALADVATVGLLQERAIRQQQIVAEQLQGALNSRIVIEQAKGLLAGSYGIDMSQAFHLLRGYARSNNLLLSDVATAAVTGAITVPNLAPPANRGA